MNHAVTIASNYKTPKITPEFQQAFDLLENTRQNVFLTGNAGTGKSTFLHYFREHTRKKNRCGRTYRRSGAQCWRANHPLLLPIETSFCGCDGAQTQPFESAQGIGVAHYR